jgi:hypothetical protein
MSGTAKLSFRVMYFTLCHRGGRPLLGEGVIGGAVDELIRLMTEANR